MHVVYKTIRHSELLYILKKTAREVRKYLINIYQATKCFIPFYTFIPLMYSYSVVYRPLNNTLKTQSDWLKYNTIHILLKWKHVALFFNVINVTRVVDLAKAFAHAVTWKWGQGWLCEGSCFKTHRRKVCSTYKCDNLETNYGLRPKTALTSSSPVT